MFKLTFEADEDLENIYSWGYEIFGEAQANAYYNALYDLFARIGKNPLHYPKIDYILEGARRAVHGSHSIYYTVNDDSEGVLILGIVGKQDVSVRFRR